MFDPAKRPNAGKLLQNKLFDKFHPRINMDLPLIKIRTDLKDTADKDFSLNQLKRYVVKYVKNL